MEKQKRWQFYLILAVIILTLYNILPTLFYYSKPLRAPIDESRAQEVASTIADRVNGLEEDTKEWLYSFSNLLGVKPKAIEVQEKTPNLVAVSFQSQKDAELFKRFLPRAGALISFVPSQLELYPDAPGQEPTTVMVSRQISTHLNQDELKHLFRYSPTRESDGSVAPLYQQITNDRVSQLALALGGPSKIGSMLSALSTNGKDKDFDSDMVILSIAKEMAEVERTLGKDSPIAKRIYQSFVQTPGNDREALVTNFVTRAEALKSSIESQQKALQKEKDQLKEKGEFLPTEQEERLMQWAQQRQTLTSAIAIAKQEAATFKKGQTPLTEKSIATELAVSAKTISPQEKVQVVSLEGRNPFVKALAIDWGKDKIFLQFYPDVEQIRQSTEKSEVGELQKERLNHLVINEIARASRSANEKIAPDGANFAINLNTLTNTESILAMDLGFLAKKQMQQITDQLSSAWQPTQPDLTRDAYPILTYDSYKAMPKDQQKLGLVVYAPAAFEGTPTEGFRNGSLYVVAKGLNSLIQKQQQAPNAPENQALGQEINQLMAVLQRLGFIGYPGSTLGMDPSYRKDYIFEKDGFYEPLITATREDFTVNGSKRLAVLDFTDVEQRILTQNKIDDHTQEDLLKWKEEYQTAQVDHNATNRYLVPAPTKNPLWQNFILSWKKYFRGDDRKVLKWGLDLSGGKTVRIGLRDHNNRPVTNPDDLRQAVNELYTRINALGVSERTIHIEGNNIILDFPGARGLSAADLIQASSMSFHIANEKFSPANRELRDSVQQFLQEVWNEAVVTNRKDGESVRMIAWQQLGGDSPEPANLRPISSSARELYEHGLRIANPNEASSSHTFDDTLSTVAVMRGEEFSEWQGQSNPLMIIFNNYALKGADLTNVQVGYDPAQGNVLTFGIKRSYDGDEPGSPRDDFYAWTSQFSEDRVAGTPKETYSQGHGWRMAVLLNGKVISSPVLKAALRDGATISGHFTQREINQLAADLKAGSLTFTPQILSEENVSPELGSEERVMGVTAAIIALVLVVVAMIGYYHFAGVVASCAVLFNILILWGVLQNLGAALTLPGIAGIVLTIGMAVDANVLVFERIREEFSVSGRIASAIQAGYRKAFSAIVDSNITTIIAAFILLQFDSGPIKAFAVTLIIGIISSMFTSLFMTRYFFAGWVQNPKNKALTMSQFINKTNFNFLAYSKQAIAISLIVILAGSYFFVTQRKTLFGMDFTGGYSLNVEMVEQPGMDSYRIAATEAILAQGATSNDVHVRALSKPNQLRIQLGTGMEEKGHPFYQMPEKVTDGPFQYSYQQNPRINWVVNALANANLKIVPSQLTDLPSHWTVVSGQLSDSMRNNALLALFFALISILIYITFRFEFKFAVSAVIGLLHDVLITVGIIALLNALGVMVQIDLQVIGAIMTIIGYSLNDTIIVFDRIREDLHIMRKMSFAEIINHALNVTLSRTIMTSGTTLLVLVVLVVLGGKSIFSFALVMTIGVLVGTASSLFIAAPMLLYFHEREKQQDAIRKLQ